MQTLAALIASFAVAAEPDAAQSLAKGWHGIYTGDPKAAISAIDGLTRSSDNIERQEAMHIKARALWLAGDEPTQRQAGAIWAHVSKEAGQDSIVAARLDLARSLGMAARGLDRDAVSGLESLKKSQEHTAVEIEAAIDLAVLYAKSSRRDEALSSLAWAKKSLEMAESHGIPKPVAEAFATGIRSVRESLDNPARPLFLRAQTLQRQGQYAKALGVFAEVSRDFAGTDEDHRSQLEIGSCHVGLKNTQDAIEHWRQFTAAAPAGPWRGQAFVRLIDLLLSEQLDFDGATQLIQQAKAAMPAALANDTAKASWKDAGYDIWLRFGIIELCRDRDPAAADAFSEARRTTTDLVEAGNLVRLTEVATSNLGLIPNECRADGNEPASAVAAKSPADRVLAETAIKLGVAYRLAGREDAALEVFERVIGRPAAAGTRGKLASPAIRGIAGASPAQVAFAAFGKGLVTQRSREQKAAQSAFLGSLRIHPQGSWHDETLFQLATRSNLPAEALPHWRRLADEFPKSPRRELAMYRAGLAIELIADALSEKAAGAGGAQAVKEVDRAWQDAAAMLARLTEAFPNGPYSGEAFARQIDIALERRFDLTAASAAAIAGLAWVSQAGDGIGPMKAAPRVPLAAWADSSSDPPVREKGVDALRIFVAAGLVAHLQGDNAAAIELFKKANALDASRRKGIGAETSMDRLIAVVEGRAPAFSPHDLLKGLRDDKHRTAVLLADLSLVSFDPARAGALYDRILTAEPPFSATPPELEAYLLLRLGQSLEFQRKHDEAVAVLERLYEPKYSKFRWASDGIFRLGTWSHNATQDPAKAMRHWEHVFTKTPKHPEAERALFYFCVAAKRQGELAKAAEAMEEFLRRYPASLWTVRVRDYELPEVKKLVEESRK